MVSLSGDVVVRGWGGAGKSLPLFILYVIICLNWVGGLVGGIQFVVKYISSPCGVIVVGVNQWVGVAQEGMHMSGC